MTKRRKLARAAEAAAETVSDVVAQAGAAAGAAAETVADAVAQAGAVAGRLLEPRGAARMRRLNRIPIPNLFEIHPEARTAPRRELGTLTIPVAEIRGTAVEGPPQRGSDFTPLPSLKGVNWEGRWQRLRSAQDRLVALPPIDVLQTDDGYWVIDGHNRVALAMFGGQDDIDANVTHVHLPGSDDANIRTGSLEAVLAESRELRAAAAEGRLGAAPTSPAEVGGGGEPGTAGEAPPTTP